MDSPTSMKDVWAMMEACKDSASLIHAGMGVWCPFRVRAVKPHQLPPVQDRPSMWTSLGLSDAQADRVARDLMLQWHVGQLLVPNGMDPDPA